MQSWIRVLKNGMWCWRPALSEALVDIQSRLLDVKFEVAIGLYGSFLRMVLMLVLTLGTTYGRRRV